MDCVEHTGAYFPSGYGAKYYLGATRRAHRVAYCESRGVSWESIKGVIIRHTCDNRRCVNPKHLLEGTHKDNMQDMRIRNRAAKGLDNAAGKLTPEQVLYIQANYVPQSKEFGTVALARMFGVHNSTIGRVIRGIYHKQHVLEAV